MSDVMLIGILNMPMDYPLDQLTFTQLVSTCRRAANRIEGDKAVRGKIWDVVGECGSGITDKEKIAQIEKILLDSEDDDF